VRASLEEDLVLVRVRDGYHDGRGDGEESVAKGGTEFPGVGGSEVVEYKGGVDLGD
jgi:hypothetical protein